MKTYRFTIILKGIATLDDEIPERLYEAGCDDSSPYSGEGVTGARFDRESSSLETAIISAITDIRQAGYETERIEIDSIDAAQLDVAS